MKVKIISPPFIISATVGTIAEPLCYARGIERMEDAERMQATARRYGYRDAMIESQKAFDQRQEDVRKQKRERRLAA